jgi:hypothetical protein
MATDTVRADGGAGDVAVPVQGKVSLANHPFSMGGLYDNAPEWRFDDIDVAMLDYLTDANSAAAMLPEPMATLPIPELPGYAAVKQIWAHYRDSSFGPYNELLTVIPCLHDGQMWLYVPLIYVTNDAALAGGREIGGWPKKLAKIDFDRVGDEYRCTLERHGERLASVRMTIGGPLFSTPLPADKTVSLPDPYNMTLPLPPPTGSPQESVALPTASFKVMPAVGSDTPLVARVIGAPWRLKGTFSSGSGGSASYRPSDEDPFYKLPILKILGSMYFEGNMTLAFKEMTILADLLNT